MSTTRKVLAGMATGTAKATVASLACTAIMESGVQIGKAFHELQSNDECFKHHDVTGLWIKGAIFLYAMAFFVPVSIMRDVKRNLDAPSYDIEAPRLN